MSYSVAEYVCGWFCDGLQDGEKNDGFISNRFRLVHQRDIRTDRHADDSKGRECNALHFA